MGTSLSGLVEILEAMADRIGSAFDGELDVNDQPLYIQVYPGWVVHPTPPTVDMFPGPVSRGTETAGFVDIDGEYIFTVRTRVAVTDNFAMQDLLLRFMDDTDTLSLAAALDSEPTLGGAASSLICRNPSGYREYRNPDGSPWLIGFEFECVVVPTENEVS